jgi:tellurium resistance protein TerD
MTVSLSKGGNVSLTKEAGGHLTHVLVGLGWSPRATDGVDFDLDASLIAVNAAGMALNEHWFVFYNNLTSPDGSVVHQGDNRTGEGEGDDEQITIDLSALPAEVEKLVVLATIDEAVARKQNFGQVADAYIRVVNSDGQAELARYDLSEDAATETAMVFGEIYRNAGEWKFRAVGQGFAAGLAGIVHAYGIATS